MDKNTMPATSKQLLNAGLLSLLIAFPTKAIELSLSFGQNSADEIAGPTQEIEIDEDDLISFGVAWDDGPNGQGQILFSGASHQFTTESGGTSEVDIYHGHFNGIAQFRQQNYITTVSLGLGASYFDVADAGDEWYPSMSVALGTRYRLSKALSIVTELRSTITLTEEDDEVFCLSADNCLAEFDEALFFENSISVGVAYRF